MQGLGDTVAGLAVKIRTQPRGPVVARLDVTGRDIAEALAELSFEVGLRCDGESYALSELSARLRPFRRDSDDSGRQASGGGAGRHFTGFTLEAESRTGRPVVCQFERRFLDPVATRASRQLIEAGKLAEGDLYYYDIDVSECSVGPLDIESIPVTPELRPIAPLLARARVISGDPQQAQADESYAKERASGGSGASLRLVEQNNRRGEPKDPEAVRDDSSGEAAGVPSDDNSWDYPVFYTRAAFEKAERISRKGAESNPAVESGGVLLGTMCWCAESRSLFCIVEDALEASDSEGTTFSLTFTAKTWGRVQAVLRARRRQPETQNLRIVGQMHGHNFLPYSEGETCDGCPAQGTCGFTTAFLSESDRRWCRAVFPQEPWQLSHIFGLTPRREKVSAFYGQRGAALERRDYYILGDPF